MFDWVQVRALAGPLKDIYIVVPKPLLHCLGCMLRVIFLLEMELPAQSEILSALGHAKPARRISKLSACLGPLWPPEDPQECLKSPTRDLEMFNYFSDIIYHYIMSMIMLQKCNIMLIGWLANTTGLMNSHCLCLCHVHAHFCKRKVTVFSCASMEKAAKMSQKRTYPSGRTRKQKMR